MEPNYTKDIKNLLKDRAHPSRSLMTDDAQALWSLVSKAAANDKQVGKEWHMMMYAYELGYQMAQAAK